MKQKTAIRQPDWVRSAQAIFFVIATYAVTAIIHARADARLDEVELAAAFRSLLAAGWKWSKR